MKCPVFLKKLEMLSQWLSEPWVARAHMGSACVALLREGPGPDEDIIQPTLHRREGGKCK